MNREKEVLNKYNIVPQKISYKKNTKILETTEKKYCIKCKKTNSNIFTYLNKHNFLNYIKQINDYSSDYELTSYIEEKQISKEQKAKDLIYIMSNLHNKTTIYKEINYDEVNNIYQKITNKINNLLSYYYTLQEKIENKIYMSPAEYHLIRKINIIYISLNNARSDIDNWYKIKKTLKKERQVFLHNNISLDNFVKSDYEYLINWENAIHGTVVYDYLNFFKNEYRSINMEEMYKIYQCRYQFNIDEKLLLYALLQIPWKINFEFTNYINTVKVNQLLEYLEKANHLILQEHQENQKAK